MSQDSFEYEERVFSGCTWILFIFLAIVSFIFPPILIFSFPLGLALRATGKKRIVSRSLNQGQPVTLPTQQKPSTDSEGILNREVLSQFERPKVREVENPGLVSLARSKELLTVTTEMTEDQITSRIGPPANRIVVETPPYAIEKLMYHDDQFIVVMIEGESALVRNNTKTES